MRVTTNTGSEPSVSKVEIELPHGHKIIIRDLGTDIAVIHELRGEQEALLSVCHDETFQAHTAYPADPPTIHGTEITKEL